MKTDSQLQADVMDEIKWDPVLAEAAPQIGVTAKDGVITLSGQVDSFYRKHALEAAAQRVHGVSYVAMDVEVQLGSHLKKHDSDIASAIKESFRHLSMIDEEAIDVRVDNGYVTLEGTLNWNYQRQAAEAYVRNVDGVTGINNLIQLKNEPCDERSVIEKIHAAFHRHAAADAGNVQVKINGEKVVLSGKVRTWVEKKDAENIAWSSPGIQSVENNINVVQPYIS